MCVGTKMPTIECLDERTRQILDRIEDMDERLTKRFDDTVKTTNTRIALLESSVEKIKIDTAEANGKRTVAVWVGGMALALLGAVGNMILVWLVGPKGPLGH